MKSIIIGTAGHIDHGKTALVKALTGIDADRLEEEKRRGVTIDLGFAHLELPIPGGEADQAPRAALHQDAENARSTRIASGLERSDRNQEKRRDTY
jgi:translation initiation factor 2 gamma subunit (eIF-2gamma)